MTEIKESKEKDFTPNIGSTITRIRQDNNDKFQGIGEVIDNSSDWGKAKNIHIGLREDEITISDDGNGIEKDKMEAMLKFGVLNRKIPKDAIGKFHVGLKEGTIIFSNKLSIHTLNKSGEKLTTTAKWKEMEENDSWTPSTPCRNFNTEDSESYYNMMKNIDNKGTGTIITLERFISGLNINKQYFEDLCYYLSTLRKPNTKLNITVQYKGEKKKIEFKDPTMYNELQIDQKKYKNIEFKNKYKFVIYKNDNNDYKVIVINNGKEYIFSKNKITELTIDKSKINDIKNNYTLFYEIKAQYSILNSQEQNKQKEQIKVKNDKQQLKGYRIYRQGRNVTGKNAIFSPTLMPLNQWKANGVRIMIDFPANIGEDFTENSDKHWGVTTLKKITIDKLMESEPYVKKILKFLGNKSSKQYDNYRNKSNDLHYGELEIFFNNFKKKYKDIKNKTEKKLKKLLNEFKEDENKYNYIIENNKFNDTDDHVFTKQKPIFKEVCKFYKETGELKNIETDIKNKLDEICKSKKSKTPTDSKTTASMLNVIKSEIIKNAEVGNSLTSEQNNDAPESESDESKVSIDAQESESEESKVSTDARKSDSESDESKDSNDAQKSESEESKDSNITDTLDDKEDLLKRIDFEHNKLIDNKSANILSLKKLLQEYKNINSTEKRSICV